MKAVIAAGGRGTRLYGLTDDKFNKHILRVHAKQMIVYVVETLVAGGVTDIRVSLNGAQPEAFMKILGTGERYGCSISYSYENEILGPGKSLLNAEKFVGGEDFVFALGDTMAFVPLDFKGKKAPHMFLMPQKSPGEYFDDFRKYMHARVNATHVTGVVEKAKEPWSDLVVVAYYLLPGQDVFNRVRAHEVEVVARGNKEEITTSGLLEQYVNEGKMTYELTPPESVIDAGTVDGIHKAELMFARMAKNKQGE